MKKINKARAKYIAIRKKYQTSNYTSYAIAGDVSVPMNVPIRNEKLDESLKIPKHSALMKPAHKKSSSITLGLAQPKSPLSKLRKIDSNISTTSIDYDENVSFAGDTENYSPEKQNIEITEKNKRSNFDPKLTKRSGVTKHMEAIEEYDSY